MPTMVVAVGDALPGGRRCPSALAHVRAVRVEEPDRAGDEEGEQERDDYGDDVFRVEGVVWRGVWVRDYGRVG